MLFEIQHTDPSTNARAGKITTDHGEILTPIFMPVGTVGSVKAKIGNYKSVAGVTGHSNASKNTLSMYKNHGHLNSTQLQNLIQSGTNS